MFCRKCGNELKENTKYCPHCGEKIELKNNDNTFKESVSENNILQDENKYLFLNTMSHKNRDKILYINRIKERIYQIIFGILTAYFVYRQIELQENYKFIIYVIRYIQYIIPYLFIYSVFEEIVMLLTVTHNEINKNKSKTMIFIFEGLCLFILFLISERISNPDNMIGLFNVIAEKYFLIAIFKYLMFIKAEILMLIIVGIIKYYINEKILGIVENSKYE